MSSHVILFWLGGGEHKGGLLDIDTGLMIWTVITFILLLIILTRFAWKPVLEKLQNRENRIKLALETADRARREAEQLEQRNKDILYRAELEAQKVIRDALETAEHLRLDILKVATQQAAEYRNRALQELQQEILTAKIKLKCDIADLAVQAAEKIIRATLDEERHRKLVEDFINELPETLASQGPSSQPPSSLS